MALESSSSPSGPRVDTRSSTRSVAVSVSEESLSLDSGSDATSDERFENLTIDEILGGKKIKFSENFKVKAARFCVLRQISAHLLPTVHEVYLLFDAVGWGTIDDADVAEVLATKVLNWIRNHMTTAILYPGLMEVKTRGTWSATWAVYTLDWVSEDFIPGKSSSMPQASGNEDPRDCIPRDHESIAAIAQGVALELEDDEELLEEASEDECEVEKVLKSEIRGTPPVVMYQVKWAEDDALTWEPYEHLEGCDALLDFQIEESNVKARANVGQMSGGTAQDGASSASTSAHPMGSNSSGVPFTAGLQASAPPLSPPATPVPEHDAVLNIGDQDAAALKQPVSKQPLSKQPVSMQRASIQTTREQPSPEQPIPKQPISQQPISKQPISKQPISQQPISSALYRPLTPSPTPEPAAMRKDLPAATPKPAAPLRATWTSPLSARVGSWAAALKEKYAGGEDAQEDGDDLFAESADDDEQDDDEYLSAESERDDLFDDEFSDEEEEDHEDL